MLAEDRVTRETPLKLLVVSNMWPSAEKPYAGIFVKNQVSYFEKSHFVDVSVAKLERTFTSKLGSLRKYLGFIFSFFKNNFLKKYDVLHVHYFFPTIIVGTFYRLLHPSCILVVTFHGSDVTHFMQNPLLNRIGRLLLKSVSTVICVSDDLGEKVEEALGRPCDVILSAGVDQEVFRRRNDVSSKWDLLFVGSFIQRKGLDLLVEALNQIDDLSLSLCFVGSGSLRNEIDSIANSHTVEVIENVNQARLCEIYNASRFHVLPSRYEPFGLVVTEAMFCGVPVIGSSVGGIPEQIEHDVNGWLVEPDSVDSLVAAIRTAMNLDAPAYERMVEKCLRSNRRNGLEYICEAQIGLYTSRAANEGNI